MHPFIQHLAEKDEHDLEEAAIIGLVRIMEGKEWPDLLQAHTELLCYWLKQLNPFKLSGPALGEWADKIVKEQLAEIHAKTTT